MTHDLPWSFHGHSNAVWKGFGGFGVDLFFAISGVLICWRLLEDESKLGSIRLKSFYIRRIFRIQPAALAYLAVVALLFLFGVVRPNWWFLFSAAFSFVNFVITGATPPGAAAFLGHFWTLAVEEQFYVLLSLYLYFFRERRILLLTIFLAILLGIQTHGLEHGEFSEIVSPRRTYWVLQYLLLPSLMILCLRQLRLRPMVSRYLKPWVAVVMTAIMLVGYQWSNTPRVFFGGWSQFPVMDFIYAGRDYLFYGFGLLVVAVMLNPRSLTTRLLETAPLRLFGRLSYSIYLWHILFFIPIYLGALGHVPPLLMFLSGRPWKYFATGVVATLSYYLLEKPFIRLGHRLAPPATAGHTDLPTSPIATEAEPAPFALNS